MNIVTAFDSPAAISESLLAGHKVNVCPLWIKSRHMQRTSRCPLCAPIADMCSALADVRFVPKADIGAYSVATVWKPIIIAFCSTSKMTAVDHPNNSAPFIAVIGPSSRQPSTGITSP